MRSLCVALTLFATASSAQQRLHGQSLLERCYTDVQLHQPPVVYLGGQLSYGTPQVPPPPPPLSGTGQAVTGAPSGAGAGEALLVVAVVAAVALPIVVYAIDNPAPENVQRRFDCPSFTFESSGGGEVGLGTGSSNLLGIAAGRIRMGYSYFGTDVQFSASSQGIGSFSVHGLVRPPPREHIEGGLALGYKRAYLGARMREGLEIALPHTYTLWRSGGRELGIELRPGVLLTTVQTVDVGVDLAVLLPVLEILSVRVGTRVFSYDEQILFGFNAGLSLRL